MLLAVAGLDKETVDRRVKTLASGDWSKLTTREQAALAFARKAARPAALAGNDFANLEEQFGSAAAVDVVWWVCRAHYLTRVADAFQLPLEQQNVFDGFAVTEKTGPKK